MANLRVVMLDPEFDQLSLADQTDVMRRAGATDQMLSDWVGQNATGPMLSPGPASVGFEDTSGQAAAIQEKYHEPNRARDVLPKLGEFALQGALAEVPNQVALSAAGLRGLPVLQKILAAGKGVAKAGAYGVAGYGANEGLKAAGVPSGVSEALVGVAGLGTKPGRAMLRAGVEALAGGRAAAPAAEASVPEIAKIVETAMAAREAKAVEAATRAAAIRAETSAPVARTAPISIDTPSTTAPSEEYLATIERALAERRARFAAMDAANPQQVLPRAVGGEDIPMIPDEAVSLVADPIPPRVRRPNVAGIVLVPPKGTVKPATNLGGAAKPGPAPTSADNLEEALQATLDSLKARKAGAAATTSPAAPFAGSMSQETQRRPAALFPPGQLEDVATAMPKNQGPGTTEWILGRRPRLEGNIPQTQELITQAEGLAKSGNAPPGMEEKLLDWAKRAKRPGGADRVRETGVAEPVMERKKLKLELARMLQDPRWAETVGSPEVINDGLQLEERLLGKVVSKAVQRLRTQPGGKTVDWTALGYLAK